jgi:hypothetical protein
MTNTNTNSNVIVLTVATHEEGYFNELINNKYGINIEVLGFGKPWTGYKMKTIEVYNRIKDLPDDNIIIFVDGFDTKINGTLDDAISRFKELNCKVLFSKDAYVNDFINIFQNKQFGTCRNNYRANCGLYMGYVKYVKDLLSKSLTYSCKDDQVIVNKLCKKVDYVYVDIDNKIFYNIPYEMPESLNNIDAIFIQTPGSLTINRYKRALYEYPQFFIFELFIIFMIIALVLFYLKFDIAGYSVIIFMVCFFIWIEKSCVSSFYSI